MLRQVAVVFLVSLFGACVPVEENVRRTEYVARAQSPANAKGSLVVTPPSSYSTEKGRLLASDYRGHLVEMVDEIAENAMTQRLRLADNVSSYGGLGFFTHSASLSPDERYLEIIASVPEVLGAGDDFRSKLDQVIAMYGAELLRILSSDSDIYGDERVAGYGLNLTWRTQKGSTERAVIYVPKAKARWFTDGSMNQQEFLAGLVIFKVDSGKPATLVPYVPARRAVRVDR